MISFFLNRAYTFRSDSPHIKQQFLLFTLVTLFGLWVIQTIIIGLLAPVGSSLGLTPALSLLASKLIATVASLIWNYTLYAKVVFKK